MGAHGTIDGIDEMRYSETTVLEFYDKESGVHMDVNTLRRIA